MPNTTTTAIVDRYTAVWSEPDGGLRRRGIADLWVRDGVEYVDGARFSGIDELDGRIADAYAEFVGSGKYTVDHAGDVDRHDDIVTFTIRLISTDAGDTAWAARVFLLVDGDGRIREDYQLTVQPLAAE